MSDISDLLTGIAGELTAASVGLYPPGPADQSDPAPILFKSMPADRDRCLVLTAYRISALPPEIGLTYYRLQVRARGDQDDVLAPDVLADAAYPVLHGMRGRTFGSTYLDQCLFYNSVPMGTDTSRRSERADNYTLTAN
jgi:hypothetical protein